MLKIFFKENRISCYFRSVVDRNILCLGPKLLMFLFKPEDSMFSESPLPLEKHRVIPDLEFIQENTS